MKYFTLALIFLSFLVTGCISKPHNNQKYKADWESIQNYKIPTWFQDAKFGIFIHWGPYSVPAFGSEWYPRFMYQDSTLWDPLHPEKTKPGTHNTYKHHVATYGLPSEFGYKDFIPMFKAEKFDAQEWMLLFKKSGAKYVVPVAEHHDAFAMYHSKVTPWNAVDMGPKKDIIGLLSKAAKEEGIKFGVSSHFAFNWDYYNHEDRFDTGNPAYAQLYGPAHERYAPASEEFMDLWWRRTKDIIDNYKPEILWFDFYLDRPEFTPYHPKLAAYYYNKGIEWNKEVVLQTKNYKHVSFPEGTNVLDIERGKLSDIRKDTWQTDTSVGKNSWCYVDNWKSKTANSIIDDLIDIVSKNGNLLLNVGPKADGTIPDDQKNVLLEIGEWLSINGEAIYNTRPWEKFGEGPTVVENGHHSEGKNKEFTSEDIRFTQTENALYAIVLDVPQGKNILIKSLANCSAINNRTIKSVECVGDETKVTWELKNDGLQVVNANGFKGKNALVVKIVLS